MSVAQMTKNAATIAISIALSALLGLTLATMPAQAGETGNSGAAVVIKAKKAAPAAPSVKVVKRGITSIQFGITQRGKASGFQVAYHKRGGKWMFRSTKNFMRFTGPSRPATSTSWR